VKHINIILGGQRRKIEQIDENNASNLEAFLNIAVSWPPVSAVVSEDQYNPVALPVTIQ
jgi:hypothetical protein